MECGVLTPLSPAWASFPTPEQQGTSPIISSNINEPVPFSTNRYDFIFLRSSLIKTNKVIQGHTKEEAAFLCVTTRGQARALPRAREPSLSHKGGPLGPGSVCTSDLGLRAVDVPAH